MQKIILTTPRFDLREMTVDDAEVAYALNSDLDVVRYTGDVPFADVAAARAFLANYTGYNNGYGRWAVIDRATNEYMGWCGLKYRTDTAEVDLGYRFAKRFWGRGIATETSLACLKYAFETLELPQVIGEAALENPASIRVLQKVGMTFWQNSPDNCGDYAAVMYKIVNG
jgi:[ribosomal protein S5]-alanine N-acetyltransferase